MGRKRSLVSRYCFYFLYIYIQKNNCHFNWLMIFTKSMILRNGIFTVNFRHLLILTFVRNILYIDIYIMYSYKAFTYKCIIYQYADIVRKLIWKTYMTGHHFYNLLATFTKTMNFTDEHTHIKWIRNFKSCIAIG